MELRLLTLNCWGIPIVSKDRKARMKALADIFGENRFDVVCLQELWSASDYEMIAKIAHDSLPFGHYFHSGVLGSGVCILSKYSIKETFFHQWTLNGYIHKIQHGDWFGGKGVGLCRIKVGDFIVNVYSAHLHAVYNSIVDDYRVHRIFQAFDTAQFIRLTSGDANFVILAGDLNIELEDLEYRLLVKTCGLSDAYLMDQSSSPSVIGTSECASNSYTNKTVARKCPEGKRIDHVLFRAGKNTKCKVTNYSLPLPSRVPGCNFSYSDHEAVQVNFEFSADTVSDGECTSTELLEALHEGIQICNNYMNQLETRRIIFIAYAILIFIGVLATTILEVPVYFKVAVLIFNILISFFTFFFFLMATLWNAIEKNATLAGIKSMELFSEEVTKNCSEAQFNTV